MLHVIVQMFSFTPELSLCWLDQKKRKKEWPHENGEVLLPIPEDLALISLRNLEQTLL